MKIDRRDRRGERRNERPAIVEGAASVEAVVIVAVVIVPRRGSPGIPRNHVLERKLMWE